MRLAAPSHPSLGRSGRWCAIVGVLAAALAPRARSGRIRLPTATAAAAGSATTSSATSSPTCPAPRELTDPNLVNAWGLGFGPTTPAWIADNGMDVSTLYSGASATAPDPAIVPLVVSIPGGAPTGLVFNPSATGVRRALRARAPARRASCSPRRRA